MASRTSRPRLRARTIFRVMLVRESSALFDGLACSTVYFCQTAWFARRCFFESLFSSEVLFAAVGGSYNRISPGETLPATFIRGLRYLLACVWRAGYESSRNDTRWASQR